MTYREAIQAQIAALQQVYDNANALRDVAFDGVQKNAFNYLRRDLPALWHQLQVIDNAMPDGQAAEQLRGTYHVDTES